MIQEKASWFVDFISFFSYGWRLFAVFYSFGRGCKLDTSPEIFIISPYLITYFTPFVLPCSFTITTTNTIIKITPTGTEIPTIRGIFTEDDVEGLNPLATKAEEVVENPAKLVEERLAELAKTVGPFPLESICPLVWTDPEVIVEKDIKEGLDRYG